MTDFGVFPLCLTEALILMRQPTSPESIVTGPLKLRPEVAYTPWEDRAKELLVAEMEYRKLGYKEFCRLYTSDAADDRR